MTIKQKQLLLFNVSFLILYSCLSFLMAGKLFCYSSLIGFIGIYFIVAYVKKYMIRTASNSRMGLLLLLIGVLGWIAENLLSVSIGLKFERLSAHVMRWNQFINPCYIMVTIGAFVIVTNYAFQNKFINYMSSLSLLIYMIHCNRIVRDYVRFDFFEWVLNTYTYNRLLIWVIIFSGVLLICGTVFSNNL